MPFKVRPHLTLDPCIPHYEAVYKQVTDDTFERVVTSERKVLPPCKNFDTQKMIDAGLPLDRVNTKILDSSFVESSEIETENETETETETDKE